MTTMNDLEALQKLLKEENALTSPRAFDVEKNSFQYYKALFVRSVWSEWTRTELVESHKTDIHTWVTSLCYGRSIYKLITAAGIAQLVNTITSNEVIFNFVISVADRFYIELDDDDGTVLMRLLRVLSNSCHIGDFRKDGEKSALPEVVVSQLLQVEDKNDFLSLLQSNSWLVITLMIFITYQSVMVVLSNDAISKKTTKFKE